MNWDKWICSITVLALLLTAFVCTRAYGETQMETREKVAVNSKSLRSLSPQPEPPDRKILCKQETKKPEKRHETRDINPQPEPPGRKGR